LTSKAEISWITYRSYAQGPFGWINRKWLTRHPPSFGSVTIELPWDIKSYEPSRISWQGSRCFIWTHPFGASGSLIPI
jgi:hypothetical protein